VRGATCGRENDTVRSRSRTRGIALALAASALLAVAGSGCGGDGHGKDITIALDLEVWPYGTGTGKRSYSWTLRCNPLGGSLPHGDRACFRLATDPHPFAQAPPRKPCLEIYGGPAVATVSGTLRGRRIDATLNRADSCQLDRWERVEYLFPRYV
jgi:hypothetical protein